MLLLEMPFAPENLEVTPSPWLAVASVHRTLRRILWRTVPFTI
jgi:hypothetical protein